MHGTLGGLSQRPCGLRPPQVSEQGCEVTTTQGTGKAVKVPQGLAPSLLTAMPRNVAMGLSTLPPPWDWPKPRALLPWACAHAWPSPCCR